MVRSGRLYLAILRGNLQNGYAANGVGLVFAEMKLLDVARETFTKVSIRRPPRGLPIIQSYGGKEERHVNVCELSPLYFLLFYSY